MDDYFDEEDFDQYMDYLIEGGYIIQIGYDKNNKPLYKTTKKFLEIFPDFYDEQIEKANKVVFELWELGLIDVTVKEEINDWVVMPNEKTFSCDLDNLTEEQYDLMTYIRSKG